MAKKKGTRTFAMSPIRRLMSKNGAEIVSKDALNELIFHLEQVTANITNTSLKLVKNSKRKKITSADIKLAINM